MPPEEPSVAAALQDLRISLGEAIAEPSGSAEAKEVRVRKRPLTAEEGQRIVDQAATWEGTPYELVGHKSRKGADGEADCSGSTYHIYRDAGYPYGSYKNTRAFSDYVNSSESHFILIPEIKDAQPGDILFWESHLAVFAIFSDNFGKTFWNKAENKNTLPNIWTARRKGKPYTPFCWQTIRGGAVPKVYRYVIEEKVTP